MSYDVDVNFAASARTGVEGLSPREREVCDPATHARAGAGRGMAGARGRAGGARGARGGRKNKSKNHTRVTH